MPMPRDVGVIDLMMAIPNNDTSNYYDFIKPLLMDEESRQQFQMPAEYMFKNLPQVGEHDDYAAYTVEKMDEFGIAKGMIGVDEDQYETQNQAVKDHPDRSSRVTTLTRTTAWKRCVRFAASKKPTT